MNTQQLQCFVYVAERLNFMKTAEALTLHAQNHVHIVGVESERTG